MADSEIMAKLISFLNTGLGTALVVLILGGIGTLAYNELKERRKRNQEKRERSEAEQMEKIRKADRLKLIQPCFSVALQNMGGSNTPKGLLQVIELKLINNGGKAYQTKIATEIIETPLDYGIILPSTEKKQQLKPKIHGFWCSFVIRITAKNQDQGVHTQTFYAKWDDSKAKYVAKEENAIE